MKHDKKIRKDDCKTTIVNNLKKVEFLIYDNHYKQEDTEKEESCTCIGEK